AFADEQESRCVRIEPRASLGRTPSTDERDAAPSPGARGRTPPAGRRQKFSAGAGSRRSPIHPFASQHRQGGSDMSVTHVTSGRTSLTPNQVRGFWAAWGGWALDGMDSFIYALVLTPAMTELLPRSGIPSTPANVLHYGAVLLALFLVGWGLSMAWG